METNIIEAIIPTIVVPFAFLGFVLSAAAAAIASLFGITLKTEGPRRLLEVLLKPKVIISALILNALLWGGYQGYRYWNNAPSPLFWIKKENKERQEQSLLVQNRHYKDVKSRAKSAVGVPSGDEIVGFEMVWERELGAGVFNQPTLSGKSLFLGRTDGTILELDSRSGKKLREFFTGTHVTPASLIWKGFLFTGEGVHDTHHARIYKFSLMTGDLVGSFTTLGHTEGTPLLVEREGRSVLLVSAGNGGAYGVDPETMEEIWNINEGHVDSGFVEDEGLAYFVTGVEKGRTKTRPRYVFAADLFSGQVAWKKETPSSGWMPPIIVGDQVCVGLGEIYWPSSYGQLSCYDKKSGQHRWSVNHDRPITSQLAQRGKYITFADLHGSVCLVDIEEKKLNWCRETGKETSRSYASPIFVGDQTIAFASKSDGLYLFDLKGEKRVHWTSENWGSVYARIGISSEGWYIPTYTGKLFFLKPIYKALGLSLAQ